MLNLKDKIAISNFPEEKLSFDSILAGDYKSAEENCKRTAPTDEQSIPEKRAKTFDDAHEEDKVRSMILDKVLTLDQVDGRGYRDDASAKVASLEDEEEGEIRDDEEKDFGEAAGAKGVLEASDPYSAGKKEEKEGKSHSKPHKEKKKKKKKHKHKHKHKHRHESRERDKESRHRDSSDEPSDRHASLAQDDSRNAASPLPSDDES